eukprot:TRINITY_DN582_c0_g1_i6.p2 TRINITY_DN582_c0_g1~~TRINITY_DN582_c0_g1_i6.p2  ORF type:complete len:189 (+),score=23.52 TRINITY_DN582_c0_g1_i6:1899-2465(+)
MQFKRTWKQVDGVLLLDKPLGMTSNDALQKARRLFSAAKGGHTGTLDPLATGLLPLCFGEATKFSADLLDADKTYEAVLKLGVTTDSGDAEGQVTSTATVDVNKAQIAEVLPQFVGDIQQIPPMYSALIPVSYTHLTLPTICSVQISVVAVSLKKKKKKKRRKTTTRRVKLWKTRHGYQTKAEDALGA